MRKGVKLVKLRALSADRAPDSPVMEPYISHSPLLSVVTSKSSLGPLDGIIGLSGHVGTQTQIRDCSNQVPVVGIDSDNPPKKYPPTTVKHFPP